MAGKDDEKNGLAPQPSSEPKIRRKQIRVPKPIIVPDSCKITPDGRLDSPWMKLGRDIGLDLTAPRTPEDEHVPTGQLENAPAAEPKPASTKKKTSSSKQKRAAASPSTATFTPKKLRKSRAKKNGTPSNHPRHGGSGVDTSYSSSSLNTDTRKQDRIGSFSDLEDDYYPEQVGGGRGGDSGTEEAYQYGARDDDEEDEYATIYDGDAQGAKMRRY